MTAKGLSQTYTCIHSPPSSPPIQAATRQGALFHVLYTSSLLVIHIKYSSVCMSIPNSQTIPSLILPPGQPKVQGFLNRQILDPHPDLWNQSARIALRTLLYFPRASPVAQQVKNPPVMQETQDMRVQSLDQEAPLEKEVATHSSILAWKTPWTEEPGRLQSKGSQRAGHD